MIGLFLFTFIFIVAHFFEKSDYDRMKEAEEILTNKSEEDESNNK